MTEPKNDLPATFQELCTQMDGTIGWIADSGRFSTAIKDGALDEVEPVGTAWVNLSSVVDFFPWKHKLPTTVK